MNDREVIMHNAQPKQGFMTHEKAIEAAGLAINVVDRLPWRLLNPKP